jgi:calcineurin-like phosphoesterase family protein
MIFLTSDQHFLHVNILRYSERAFSTVEEMGEAFVKNFNEVVSGDDITYHIGDFSLKEEAVPRYLPRLNGTHILILGNHDLPHPTHRSHRKKNGTTKQHSIEEATKRYIDYGFKEVHLSLELDEFLLHHMPYQLVDRHDKFDVWRPTRTDKVLLHGHVHNSFRYKANPQQYNVGVDVNGYAPISIDAIRSFLKDNPDDQ